MELLADLGAALAWVGASLLVLSEARRGVALGLGITALGIGLLAGVERGLPAAAALGGGGVLAAALRLRDGGRGWGVLPPGSTPRVIMSLAALLLSALVGGSMMTGPGGAGRVAALTVGGLACARLLTTHRRASALSAAAAMALALGLVGTAAGAWVAGLVAVGLGAIGADDGLEATA